MRLENQTDASRMISCEPNHCELPVARLLDEPEGDAVWSCFCEFTPERSVGPSDIPQYGHYRNHHDPQVEPCALEGKFDERREEDRKKRYLFHITARYCCHPPPSA